jgi:hypothetical protein
MLHRKVPRWLAGGAVGAALLLGWALFQSRMAVVTVHFMPREEAVLDTLYATLGGEKQHATGLRRGQSHRFTFQPDVEFPLELAFWVGAHNGGWTGPHLRPRHRLEVTLSDDGHITWRECDWPCW